MPMGASLLSAPDADSSKHRKLSHHLSLRRSILHRLKLDLLLRGFKILNQYGVIVVAHPKKCYGNSHLLI